jgi:hypothetical protein
VLRTYTLLSHWTRAVSVGRLGIPLTINDDKGAWMLSYTEDASGSQLTDCVEVVIPLLDAVVASWPELAEMFDDRFQPGQLETFPSPEC